MTPEAPLPWQKRVESVKRLIDADFGDRISFRMTGCIGDVERER